MYLFSENCRGVICPYRQLCGIFYGVLACSCSPLIFKCAEKLNWVCGHDGNSYTSMCSLQREECHLRKFIGVDHFGRCQVPPANLIQDTPTATPTTRTCVTVDEDPFAEQLGKVHTLCPTRPSLIASKLHAASGWEISYCSHVEASKLFLMAAL